MTQNLKVENDNDKKKSKCFLLEVSEDCADSVSFDYNTYIIAKRDLTVIYFEVYEVVE